MGEHSAPDNGVATKLKTLAGWVWTNRRKVAAAALVVLPLAARYIPGFPAEEAVSVLRSLLGA